MVTCVSCQAQAPAPTAERKRMKDRLVDETCLQGMFAACLLDVAGFAGARNQKEDDQ